MRIDRVFVCAVIFLSFGLALTSGFEIAFAVTTIQVPANQPTVEGDASCPFPSPPIGVTPTLVEQTYPTEQANFYLWASGGKLYINIDPITASFTIDVFEGYWGLSVTQDGVQRWIVLYDCIGQLYDNDVFIFTAQTFEIKDDPDWTGPALDPNRILTVGYIPQNGGNIYSWNIIPQCPECADHPVILGNVTFGDGTNCECSDSTSIIIGSGVTVESGAKVIFKAPKITVKSGASFKSGSQVLMKQQ